jgi:hypothetical protein
MLGFWGSVVATLFLSLPLLPLGAMVAARDTEPRRAEPRQPWRWHVLVVMMDYYPEDAGLDSVELGKLTSAEIPEGLLA